MALLFALWFAAAALGLGFPLVRRLAPAGTLTRGEVAIAAFLAGNLPLFFLTWAVAAFRLDRVSMLGVAVIATIAALPGLRALAPLDLFRLLGREMGELRRHWTGLVVLALAAELVLAALLGSLAIPSDGDSLSYHLALPKFDLELGRLGLRSIDDLYSAFPMMLEMHYRLAMALVSDRAAQMVHALHGVAAAFATAFVARRFGGGTRTAWLAAVLFLGIRNIAWEMATCYVDIALAAVTVMVAVVVAAWRQSGEARLLVLAGMLLGAGLNVKYHGLVVAAAFAPAVLASVARRRQWAALAVALAVAVALFLPFLIRDWLLFGSPLHPIIPGRGINPDVAVGLERLRLSMGRGMGVDDFLRSFVDVFLYGTAFFDGEQFGSPILLALIPLALWKAGAVRAALVPLSVIPLYWAVWFWGLSQQIRFLVPIYPLLAALAAHGLAAAWHSLPGRAPRVALGLGVAVLALLQLPFVLPYHGLRLAQAAGLIEPGRYVRMLAPSRLTMLYAAEPCLALGERLRPGETYLTNLDPGYHCPLHANGGDGAGAPAGGPDLARWLEQRRVRFILIDREAPANPALAPALAAPALVEAGGIALVPIENLRDTPPRCAQPEGCAPHLDSTPRDKPE